MEPYENFDFPTLFSAIPNLCSINRTLRYHLVLFQESDCESSVGSPEPASTMGMDGNTDLSLNQKLFQNRLDDPTPSEGKSSSSPSTAAHLNGPSE